VALFGFEKIVTAPYPLPLIGSGYEQAVTAHWSWRFTEKLATCKARVDPFLADERKGSMCGKLIKLSLKGRERLLMTSLYRLGYQSRRLTRLLSGLGMQRFFGTAG
jgi:hypothetical protein